MKIYRTQINDYPFMGFKHGEFRPIELIQLYRNFGKNDQSLIDAVVKFDHIYVTFRELDALDKRIGEYFETSRINRDDITTRFPDGFNALLETQSSILMAKKDLVTGIDPEELTRCRESLITITNELEQKGVLEFTGENIIQRFIRGQE
jgi:hypothetical protein